MKRISYDDTDNERVIGLSDDSFRCRTAGRTIFGESDIIDRMGSKKKSDNGEARGIKWVWDGEGGWRLGLTVSILHRSGRHRDFANAFLIRQATPARAGVTERHDGNRGEWGRGQGGLGGPRDNAAGGRKGVRHPFAPQAPMTPISRVNRDIFHDIARRKGARASRFCYPFSPSAATSTPPPAPVLSPLCQWHAPLCGSAGGG